MIKYLFTDDVIHSIAKPHPHTWTKRVCVLGGSKETHTIQLLVDKTRATISP